MRAPPESLAACLAAARRLSSATASTSAWRVSAGGAAVAASRAAAPSLCSPIAHHRAFTALAARPGPGGRQLTVESLRGFAGGAAAEGVAVARSAASAGTAAAATAATTAAAATARSRDAVSRGPRALIRAYKQLSKFRLTCLVVATASAGFVAGSPETVDKAGLAWTTLGTALCSASANTLNQAYEIASDARMARTAARPLPSGRLTRAHALGFALVTGASGVALLASQVNGLAAGIGAGNIALYACVYTPLKAVTPAATWVGALVGAAPPLLGWAGAAGALQPGSAVLAAGLYFWQLPHFMALARLGRADYAAGGLRMLCHSDPTGRRVAGCALRNSLYLLPLGFAAVAAGSASPPFAPEAAVATGVLAAAAAAFYAKPSDANARWVFRASLLHLPVWMGAFLAHRVPNTPAARAAQAPDAVRARVDEFWGAALRCAAEVVRVGGRPPSHRSRPEPFPSQLGWHPCRLRGEGVGG